MTDAMPDDAGVTRRAVLGLVLALGVVTVGFVVPPLFGWDVDARSDMLGLPPLHGFVDVRASPASALAVLLAVAGVWRGEALARTLSWRRLLLVSYVVALAWMLALALVDGEVGLTRVMTSPTEYMVSAREITDVPAMLREYVDRIPYSSPDNWPIHLAGHPPGAVLLHVALVRLGLGGDLVAALVIVAVAASIPLATMTTLRILGAERWARLAAPFLVLSPAAVFLAVSADAVFAALAAWGLTTLAASAKAPGRRGLLGWGVVTGLLLGWCVMSSYGLPLLGVLALAVLWLARSWWPLPVAALTSVAVVLAFAALGFAWWEAYPVLVDRYWDGLAKSRPMSYWGWGNLGALLVSGGPLLGAGLAVAARRHSGGARTVAVLAGAAALTVAIADLSRMSKAEVERIWLPFIPWLTLSLALLPGGWRRWGLALQVCTALVVEHLLYTSW
jgi:methylthioxylose transferase